MLKDRGSNIRPGPTTLAVVVAVAVASHAFNAEDSIALEETGANHSTIASAPRIEALIADWFETLADPGLVSPALNAFLGHESVEFRMRQTTIRGRKNLLAWARQVSAGKARIEDEIGPLELTEVKPGMIRADFDVEHREWDESGSLHIKRTHNTWHIAQSLEGGIVLIEAESVAALPDVGTGSRIQCL